MPADERPSPAQYRSIFGSYAFELDPDLNVQAPVLRAALQVWRDACGGKAMPARADIDVLDIPRDVLAHILLIDVEPGPPDRFRWRLIGTHVTSMLGRDSTGGYFDELYSPEAAKVLLTGPRWAMDNRRPVRTLGHASFADKAHIRSENVDMPLSDDGERVSMIFVATLFRIEDED
ncbi:MAG: PAS domain-containing protein [Alphaproteobacteria bacterium]